MKKLCQYIAIESSVKSRTNTEITEAHKNLQKPDLFSGHSRKYTPRNEDSSTPLGENLPDENKKVIFNAEAMIKDVVTRLVEQYDLAATRDYGNCVAKADVEINGQVLLKDVPVSHLLFLEKRVEDLQTFISKLPVLDASETWVYDSNQDMFASSETQTARTKKVNSVLVLYPATDKHPAQVREVSEDVRAGTWSTIKYSTAIQAFKRNEMLRRVEELAKAIKFAREKANSTEVPEQKIGRTILDFVFKGPARG